MFPPSLDAAVLRRAFRAGNGELGVSIDDVKLFLEACRRDKAEVLGWELWVIDHEWTFDDQALRQGSWCGGVPLRAGGSAIYGGNGEADASEAQIARYDFEAEIAPEFLPLVRVNFTLDD